MGHPKCPQLVYYDMDKIMARVIYFWCVFDFIGVWVMYALGKTVFGGKCIGTCVYRLYKVYWWCTVPTAVFMWITDFILVFEWRFWDGMNLLLMIVLDFDCDFAWN